jgi:c-di-GMP-binding flagellar brake protein YcgR
MRERRKFSRWSTREKVNFNLKDARQEELVLDISPGGMRVVLDNELKVGSIISGQFKIIANQEPFYVRGEVVWVRRAIDQINRPCYEIGIKFNKISTTPI